MYYIVFLFSIAILFLYTIYNFPWLTKYYRLNSGEFLLRKGNRVAFVSDIHIGASGSNIMLLKFIGKILRILNVDVLVIVGDLIDERIHLGSRYLEKLAELVVKILDLKDVTVIYIPSNTSHDVVFEGQGKDFRRFQLRSRNVDFIYAPHMLKIFFEECNEYIYATHGDYISRNGAIAYILDKVCRKVIGKRITGIIARKVFNIDNKAWVILGHSHVSSLDPRYRVIGLGSWIKRYYAPRECSIAIVSCKNKTIGIVFIALTKNHVVNLYIE
ncbi:MAG: metallophosphoesterase [Ignisphaera sp.]